MRVCVYVFSCSSVSMQNNNCRGSVCVCVCVFVCVCVCLCVCLSPSWMNYPLPTLRPWQTSNSNPLSTLASQSLSLQTSSPGERRDGLCDCIVCDGCCTEMTERPWKQINTSPLLSGCKWSSRLYIVAPWCRWECETMCALEYAYTSCYTPQVVQYRVIFCVWCAFTIQFHVILSNMLTVKPNFSKYLKWF